MSAVVRVVAAISSAALVLALPWADAGRSAPSVPRIVYAAYAKSPAGRNLEVFSVRIDGTDPVRLTRNGGLDWDPRLAPDGRRVVVSRLVSHRAPQAANSIVLVDRGTEVALASSSQFDGVAAYARWSPDGSWVAFQLPRATGSGGAVTSGPTDIWVIRPSGTGARRVLDAGAMNHAGVFYPDAAAWDWSPSSDSIVYQREAPQGGGETELAVVDVGTGAQRLLTAGLHPDWAPRGWLVVAVDGAGIFVVDARTAARRRVARNAGGRILDVPIWSPNGRRIAYYADDLKGSASATFLYAVNSDGSQRRKLASVATYPNRPCWTADSSTLVYSDRTWIYRVAASGRVGPVRLVRGAEPDCGT